MAALNAYITISQNGSEKSVRVNKGVIKAYYEPVLALSNELGLSQENILSTLLRLPDVISTSTEIISEDEWKLICRNFK